MHKEQKDVWYSQPFYSGPEGYKMCLSVNANGDGKSAGTYVSVFVYLMRGEYDANLTWPCRGNVTFLLVKKSGSSGVKNTSDIGNSTNGTSMRVIMEERSSAGWGFPEFIPHFEVEPYYVINGRLHFRVTTFEY